MSKIEFRLPKQDIVNEEYEWLPVVRVGRIIPFGYKQSEDDPQVLLPIPYELELLELAKEYLKTYSLREVAAWLSTESGRSISYVGLRNRIKNEQKRVKELSNTKELIKQYKEAIRKAERIESRSLGRRNPKKGSSPTET